MINRELMFEDTDRKRPYDICFLSNNTIVIKFHDIVYAIAFFQHGAELQLLFEKRQYASEKTGLIQLFTNYDTIVIDFSEINWFDTLVLYS